MLRHNWIEQTETGFLLIDVQEKLFKKVDRQCEVLHRLHLLLQAVRLFALPTIVSEQYPQGLGPTLSHLKELLGEKQQYFSKTAFSAYDEISIRQAIEATEKKQWILAGIEAHVCILQTAKSMIDAGYQVVVLNDAITSRSVYDFSTAIAELRDYGVRVTSVEAALFELVRDAQSPQFKAISQLIQSCSSACCS